MSMPHVGWFVAPAWLLLLAVLPWWLGTPLLLAIGMGLLLAPGRLHAHASLLRRGLRWGLPGGLFALQRALGGDAFAWAMALLGALVGYTLLAGLEAWLDRDLREPLDRPEQRDWPALALAPIGPGAAIVQLEPPQWFEGGCADPRGGEVQWSGGFFRLADGSEVEADPPSGSFSPDGRWFAAATGGGITLLDREQGDRYRLRGWTLCGWRDGPWLTRGEGPARAWSEVLRRRET